MALPTSDELLASAGALTEQLVERGQEIDDLRQLPQDIAEQMAAAGFYRLVTPPALGGVGATPRTLTEVCEVLAQANGSAAWCVFIGSTSQYMFGALEPDQLAEMLRNPDVITSGVFAYTGTARETEVDGEPGYEVNGTWTWGSGCRNAEWISGGVIVVDDEGDPVLDSNGQPLEARAFFRPEELDIDDDWHTSGLRGSGSCSYHARGVCLQKRRVTGSLDDSPYAAEPIYRFPRFGLLSIPIAGIALGMARASIDEVLRVASAKTPTGGRRTLAHRALVQHAVASADTNVRAARALLYDVIDEGWDEAHDDGSGVDVRRRMRSAIVHAVKTSAEVIDKMYTVVGGSSVFEDSCLQRHFRDIHVVSQHMMVGDAVLELSGRAMLGLDNEAPGL
ncbi:MAG: alkylation response protein AidB-like acyl-CoA dehydrogenase [Candidatus Poriferisodalaceae bacterium]|jgi:alkylation response protein AidB-like acyl-CoA dehydrogenase